VKFLLSGHGGDTCPESRSDPAVDRPGGGNIIPHLGIKFFIGGDLSQELLGQFHPLFSTDDKGADLLNLAFETGIHDQKTLVR